MRQFVVGVGAWVAVLGAPGVTAAQVVGTIPWQLQPYCSGTMVYNGAASSAARSDHTHAAAAGVLQCTTTFATQTVGANAIFDIEIPACASGYTVTGAGCRTPGFNQANWAINGLFSSGSGTSATTFCSGQNLTAGTITVEGTAQCCRVGVTP